MKKQEEENLEIVIVLDNGQEVIMNFSESAFDDFFTDLRNEMRTATFLSNYYGDLLIDGTYIDTISVKRIIGYRF